MTMHCNDIQMKLTPPIIPPTINIHGNILFTVKMKVYVYQTLQAIEINGIASGDRNMDIQTPGFILSNTRLDIRLDFFLDSPLLSGWLGTFLNDFLNIPLCLGLFNNPLRTTDSCTRLPLFFKHFLPS